MAQTGTELIAPEKAEADLRAALNPPTQTPPASTETKADIASSQPEAKGTEAKTPTSSTTDTSATTETKETTKTETQTKQDSKSNYAKSQERLTKTWAEVNAEKTAIANQKKEIEAARLQLQAQQRQWEEKQALSRNKVTPESHEQAAKDKAAQAHTLNEQAEAYERSAKKLEEDGNALDAVRAQDKARDLRKQAAKLEAFADSHKEAADQLRKNPDQSVQQIQARKNQELQQYTAEAAKLWPKLAENGSEFQKKVVANIQQLRAQGLDENEYPVLRYHAARFAALESDAARVPDLEKQLGAAQARVKELEKLTAPAGGTSAAQATIPAPMDFAKMTLDQQEAWLRANTTR